MIVDVPPTFAPYPEEALVRFSYLHPDVQVAVKDGVLSIDQGSPEMLAAFQHTLYRQKIYRENEAIRRSMLESLLR